MGPSVENIDIFIPYFSPDESCPRKNIIGGGNRGRPFMISETLPRDIFFRQRPPHRFDLLGCPVGAKFRFERDEAYLYPGFCDLSQIRDDLRLHKRLPQAEIADVKRMFGCVSHFQIQPGLSPGMHSLSSRPAIPAEESRLQYFRQGINSETGRPTIAGISQPADFRNRR